MKIIIPEKYGEKVARGFENPLCKVRRVEGAYEVDCPIDFGVTRLVLDMTPRQFARFIREVKVKDGFKRREGDFLNFRPRRGATLTLKMARSEIELIRRAAKERDLQLRTYCRSVLLRTALKDLGLLRE